MDIENEKFDLEKKQKKTKIQDINPFRPTPAFIGASWVAFFSGITAFIVGLWNAAMPFNDKGYYFTVLMFGLFSVVSVQKNVRDRLEKIRVSDLYYGLSWIAVFMSISLLIIGLWNADLTLSEKGFYSISYLMSLFAAIAVQKNVRDTAIHDPKV